MCVKGYYIPFDGFTCILGEDPNPVSRCDYNCANCLYDNVNQYFYCDACNAGYTFGYTANSASKRERWCMLDCQDPDCAYCYQNTFTKSDVPAIECYACNNN